MNVYYKLMPDLSVYTKLNEKSQQNEEEQKEQKNPEFVPEEVPEVKAFGLEALAFMNMANVEFKGTQTAAEDLEKTREVEE